MPFISVVLASLPAAGRAITATLALAAGLSAALALRQGIRHTTLISAWVWAVISLVAWWGAELAAASVALGWAVAGVTPLSVAAIAVSLCPAVAVLGAKRPQDRAWNFVVLSLYAIVALPAAEGLLLHPAQRVEMGGARGWFLWILILLGPINYVPTRYWLASVILAAGQIIALSPYLALVRQPLVLLPGLVGLCLAGVASAIAALASRRPNRAANSLNRQWLDFRDSFGMLWALRVEERMNAAMRQQGWNLELTWGGFRVPGDAASLPAIAPAIEPTLRTSFRGLLRRFVAGTWIDARSDTAGEPNHVSTP